MTEPEFYLVEKKPPLAWVFLNRPHKRNAMHPPAWRESPAIFADLDRDDAIRAVIVAGKGACFSAGLDVMAMVPEVPEIAQPEQGGGVKWRLLQRIAGLQQALSCVEQCRKPVIAAVHGHCVGAGLDLATACDVRICAADAVFSLREAAVGFVADLGVLQRLPLIVGQGAARQLAFTAEDFDAAAAKAMGLVSQVHGDCASLLEAAEAMALRMASNAPLAVQASKLVLNHGIGRSIEEGLRYVASVSANIVPSADLFEAMQALAERRKPSFTGR
ncbi:MAG: enoyl-CoA hydratase/isomerase family protein [Deltaproteobacteria bacterium]|nr:enoyl-CoA hydratase/isomerase family protein [Deltaproteobacteria bacterium]